MASPTFREKHIHDLPRTLTTEQLPELFLVVEDLVLTDEAYEVLRCITCQGRFGKMWVLRNEVVGGNLQVGEIAAAASRDDDLTADLSISLEDSYALSAFSGLGRAEQPGRSAADNNGIKLHGRVLRT